MINSSQLDGVALVVGSGRGIGKEVVFSLAEAGAKVIVLADINEEWAVTAAEESKKHATNKGYETATFKMDVTVDKSIQDMVDFVVQKFGRIDYAVNSAGIDNGHFKPLAELDIENFDRVMSINARGNLLCVRAEVAAMRKQEPKHWTSRNGTRDIGRGTIINIASAHSFAGIPGKTSYVVSKHAAMATVKMAGMDHSAEGIRVNAVCPTWVRTPLMEEEFQKTPAARAHVEAIVPIKRAAECEEIADVVAFLCSPAASYVNGASLIIDAAVTTTLRLF